MSRDNRLVGKPRQTSPTPDSKIAETHPPNPIHLYTLSHPASATQASSRAPTCSSSSSCTATRPSRCARPSAPRTGPRPTSAILPGAPSARAQRTPAPTSASPRRFEGGRQARALCGKMGSQGAWPLPSIIHMNRGGKRGGRGSASASAFFRVASGDAAAHAVYASSICYSIFLAMRCPREAGRIRGPCRYPARLPRGARGGKRWIDHVAYGPRAGVSSVEGRRGMRARREVIGQRTNGPR